MTGPIDDPWAELEKLAKAATPGVWEEFHNMSGPMGVASAGGTRICSLEMHGHEHANAAFIAAANPSTVLALIAAARSGRGGYEGRQAEVNKDPSAGDQWQELVTPANRPRGAPPLPPSPVLDEGK